MLDWIELIFQQNPVIPIFLTLGLGYYLGNLRIKGFTLGPVTATLIVGVLIGQMDIPTSETLKSVAFMLFLFAIGYSVGPQFFRSLKGDGMKQIVFSVVEMVVCVATCVVVAHIMGFNKGMAVGLFAGSQTVSAVIGVGADTIRGLNLPAEETKALIDIIPACYAVTYVFGTVGAAWIIANFGPVILGGRRKVLEQTWQMDEELDNGEFVPEPGMVTANRPISFRAYRVQGSYFHRPRTVSEIENYIAQRGSRHFIERVRVKGEVVDPLPGMRIWPGDVLVLGGHRESIIADTDWIGPEVTDHELLNFSTENLKVTVSKGGADGMTIRELREQPYMRGVMVRKVMRDDFSLPVKGRTRLERGDVVTLVGLPQDVSNAVPEIGYSDREDGRTDMPFLFLGIAVGCFIGAIGVVVDGVPLSLSTAGGAILMGLVMGWWRSRRPSVGHMPRPVIWFLNEFGLNLFIAVVGLASGATFLESLRTVGAPMFIAGLVCTTVPIVIMLLVGRYVFHFHPAENMGCVAGGRNAVAALGAIEDSVQSTLPMMGYTVTYAVSSIILIFSGMIMALV